MAQVRGVLLTLSMMFIVLVVFSVAFFAMKHSLVMKKAVVDASQVEVVKGLFFATDHGVNKLFRDDIVWNFTGEGPWLRYQHGLPVSGTSAFDADWNGFAAFLGTNFSNIQLSKQFSLTNMSWYHEGRDVVRTPYYYTVLNNLPRSLVLDVDPSVSPYQLEIYSPNLNGTPVFTVLSPGSVNLTVISRGKGNYYAATSRLVNPAALSTVSIVGLSGVVSVTVNANKITLVDGLGSLGNLTVDSWLNISQRRGVFIPSRVYVAADKVWKNGTIRIY
ncbi:MAG: hypothetical protein Q7R96_06510 [Nanoarchaeota archaeon]|nr:hypothetical protein [Nanoarchaeota archaeon]